MILGFLDSLPTLAVGIIVCGLAVALTTLAQIVIHRRWPMDLRKPLNELTGFVIAVVGVVYAVLLASIAILAIERYDTVEKNVETEAGLVGDIYRNATGLPEPVRGAVRAALKDYVQTVLEVEWDRMAEGTPLGADWQEQGWSDLEELLRQIAGFNPQTQGQAIFMDEILDKVAALDDARRTRMFLADNPIDGVVWWVVIIGGISTVSLALVFGVPSAPGHLLVSNILAFSIGLVLLLIFVMDRPFSGASRVTTEPFAYVQERMTEIDGGT